MINFEGGAIPEEYLTAYIIDRVNTTGTVWLGLTVGCCQCHDHKFDPITQKEYYSLFAFFHNVPENGPGRLEGQRRADAQGADGRAAGQLDAIDGRRSPIEQKLDGALARAVDRRPGRVGKDESAAPPQAGRRWTALDPSQMNATAGATLAEGRPARRPSRHDPGKDDAITDTDRRGAEARPAIPTTSSWATCSSVERDQPVGQRHIGPDRRDRRRRVDHSPDGRPTSFARLGACSSARVAFADRQQWPGNADRRQRGKTR